jgi:hypothetical protein
VRLVTWLVGLVHQLDSPVHHDHANVATKIRIFSFVEKAPQICAAVLQLKIQLQKKM